MNNVAFGWIGNGSKLKIRKRTEITQLSNIIKRVLNGYTRYTGDSIRAKNVIMYGGRLLYILSIKRAGSMWAPYPFITELCKKDNFYLLLAKGDTADVEADLLCGEFWLLDKALMQELLYEDGSFKLTYNEGRKTGDYYSLPQTLLKDVESIEFSNEDDLKDKLLKALANDEM